MTAIEEFWRPIINDFDPVGPRHPDEVKRFYVDRKEKDPVDSPARRLKASLLNSRERTRPYKALFTGHVGSGKTSELLQLGQELENNFFVVWFDAETTLVTETANHFDILFALGLAVHKAAYQALLEPEEARVKKFVQSFAKVVRKIEGRKGFSLKPDQVLKPVAALALGPFGVPKTATDALVETLPLELKVGDELVRTLELPGNRQEVFGALNDVIHGVRDKANKPLLILTDGLDKVPSLRAQQLFADSPLLIEPSCALVYSAPIELYHRLASGRVRNIFDSFPILPNPPVQKRLPTGEHWKTERSLEEDAVAVMRQVVEKRLKARSKAPNEIITPEALTLLARNSGGIMRDTVRSFREAAISAQILEKAQIDENIVQGIIAQERREIDGRLKLVHREALRQVLQHGALRGGEYEGTEDELLRGLYLLSYQQGQSGWFDAHPNVLPLL